ncbi:hypothetical protein PPHE_a3872 [Pseudoalteromonas phenolica O-BC30]|nr:hypothetical protein [Pseudoalteromonas phenolica O-BC30]
MKYQLFQFLIAPVNKALLTKLQGNELEFENGTLQDWRLDL